MGTLRYFDGDIAVCDYGNEKTDYGHMLKLLLEVDSSNTNPDKRIQQLLASDYLFHGLWNSSPEELGLIRNRADELERLGFEIPDNDRPRLTQQAIDDCLQDGCQRKLLVVRQEMPRIHRLADALQFLARLHLLSKGDERSAFILPHIEYDYYSIKAFEIKLPDYFSKTLQLNKLDMPVSFDIGPGGASPHFEDGCIIVSVRIHGKIGRYIDINNPHSINEMDLKRVCAGYLLAALTNYTSALPYGISYDSPMIERNDSVHYGSALADLMIAGKVSACPWCGRPVLLPRKSSKPFCRQSHQTRYSEKAHAMLNNGASVDEVAEAFPHIQYATINGWLPMEGR